MPINEEFAEVQENALESQSPNEYDPAETGEEAKKELARQTRRARGAKGLILKDELVNNVYPLLDMIVTWVDSGFKEFAEALDNEEEEDIEGEEEDIFEISNDLYTKIVACLVSAVQIIPDTEENKMLVATINECLVELTPSEDEEEE